MTTQTNRNRNRTPYRARARGGGQWTPAYLGLHAWYDVHAGGTSTTIVDKSGNARADATYGTTTASPLYLPYTGVPYVHLEAAGSGTNSISCTAPANTASYSAVPLGGGAPTTGAASAGAFAFTAAGDWESISLLDAGAVELARFQASASTQSGHTDAHGVAWTINRGSAGGKTVTFGPAANAVRSLALLRTDDFITIPEAAMPALSADHAFLVVARQWATPLSSGNFFTWRQTSGNTEGIRIRTNGTAVQPQSVYRNNAASETQINGTAVTSGTRNVFGIMRATDTPSVWTNATKADGTTLSGTFAFSGANGFIGRSLNLSAFQDFEFYALLALSRALSAAEVAQVVTYYGAGI